MSPKATAYTINLAILGITNKTVTVGYHSLPANRPHSYRHFLALWQGAAIPWTAPPLARQTIPPDTDSGSVVLDGFTLAPLAYVVTYGTGPETSTIAAEVPIAAESNAPQPGASVLISLTEVTATTVSVHYATLPGYRPSSYGNWVGLWPGQMSPYNPFKPLACAFVQGDANIGVIGLNGLTLARNQIYTLVYFTGPPPETTPATACVGDPAQTKGGPKTAAGPLSDTPETTTAAAMLVFQTGAAATLQDTLVGWQPATPPAPGTAGEAPGGRTPMAFPSSAEGGGQSS